MKWWETNPEKKEPEKKDEDKVELDPKDVKAKLDSISVLVEGQKKTEEKLSKIDAISDWVTSMMNKDREKADKDRKDNKEKKTQEELENLDFIGDPAGSVQYLLKKNNEETIAPLTTMLVNQQAKSTMAEHFGKTPGFELYSDPTFKAEVDKMLLSLPLAQQIHTGSMENCYYVAQGKMRKEIEEGKIKSRFTAASSGSESSGGKGGAGKELTLSNDEQKKAAAMFGMSEKEYAERFQKEHGYV